MNDQKNAALPSAPINYKIPEEWNETTIIYPLYKTLHLLFEEQVTRTPDAIALIFKNQSISYKELNSYSNQLANFLIQSGTHTESLIGVCFERSFELVISLIAILKSGGAYVPIDPEYPDERRNFMINDAEISLVLTHEKTIHKIPENCASIIYNKNDEQFKSLQSSNVNSGATAQNAAYVIYTSGSTGVPKGVINTHSGIVNRLLWMQDCFSLTSQDRILQKTPYSFDVSVWEFFWPLITGAQLVIAEPGGHRDANYLIDTFKCSAITTIHFVPSMLRLFLDSKNTEHLPSLKRVICSGEALPYTLQERFFNKLNCSLYNLYGPTEAAIDVTWWKCQRNDNRKIVPIGRPIANTKLYIVDENMNRVPVGTAGELYIGGTGVARGYLKRQDLTHERFIPDTFSGVADAKLYKTGDICRYLEDGAIEYLGRIDDQVKVHGYRIELGEIEAALLTFRSTHAASVIIKYDKLTNDTRIIAYLVTDLRPIPTDELREYLLKSLPNYMIPAQFVIIDEIPLSHNGKADKGSLPEPPNTRPQLHQEYVSPSTETEVIITSIWALNLKIDPIGINDNFFDIGGNSVIATIIANALESYFKIPIPAIMLFQYPTVSALSRHFDISQCENNNKIKDTQSRIAQQKNMIRNQKWLNKNL